jgi:hypothetical protein
MKIQESIIETDIDAGNFDIAVSLVSFENNRSATDLSSHAKQLRITNCKPLIYTVSVQPVNFRLSLISEPAPKKRGLSS